MQNQYMYHVSTCKILPIQSDTQAIHTPMYVAAGIADTVQVCVPELPELKV